MIYPLSSVSSRIALRHARKRDAVPPAARRYIHSATFLLRTGHPDEAGVLLRAAARELDTNGGSQ